VSGGRSILLVEDHAESRTSLAYVLEKRGEVVHQAPNGRAALAAARRERLHALILDLKLPDMDGLSVLDAVLAEAPGLPAIVVTGFGTIDSAVEAMKRGAADFLTKPIRVDNLLSILDRAIERAGEAGAVSTPPSAARAEMQKLGIVGESRAMQELFDALKRAAPHESTVLITGESGTGKELIARALHALGARASGPFVAINCATLSDQLLESELFGHERGAFTSADRPKPGVMESADGGTLLLDEVNEMGLGCQAKLLRAIERREFRRVGGTRKIKVNLRVIAASNVSLEDAVAAHRGRPDLYYRLKVLSLEVPPLRSRKEAIPALAQRFLDEVTATAHLPARRLTPEAQARLVRYEWPGNVRELRNVMESVALMTARTLIDVEDLPPSVRKVAEGAIHVPVGTRLDTAEREIIKRTLEAYPSVKESARVLGIGLRTLHTKIRAYGLRDRRS
jgi:two-component system, NtrC family, response regulator HydG